MILKIYKNKSKSNFISNYYIDNYYFLKNNDNDKMGIFGRTLKSVIREYKETKNYSTLEILVGENFELINCKKYNSIKELEFDYLEELI